MYYLSTDTLRVAQERGIRSATGLLVFLALLDGRRMMGELAEVCGVSTAAVTGAVDRLEVAGWVRRVRCESDRRAIFVELASADDEQVRALLNTLKEVAL